MDLLSQPSVPAPAQTMTQATEPSQEQTQSQQPLQNEEVNSSNIFLVICKVEGRHLYFFS